MKFLLMVTLLLGSVVANANVGGDIKCFERDGRELDLAYIISYQNHDLMLQDCTYSHGGDMATTGCRPVGELYKKERQNESCLVLKNNHGPGPGPVTELDNRSWSLCMEQQETLENPRLVPVTVTADRQSSRIYCERSILHVL